MITDWLMVLITLVYVGATIAIYKSNKDALKASEKLVDASIAQVGILKEQIKISTNLQLFESRVRVLKQLEEKTGFLKHESLLDILFSAEIVNLENEIITLCIQRNILLFSYSSISYELKYMTYFNENFSKLKSAYVTKLEIGFFIDNLEIIASPIKVDGKPILDPEKSKGIRGRAFEITDEIEKKIETFFVTAKQFIISTIE